MSGAVYIVSGLCVALGWICGWGIGRYLSRQLLATLWIGLGLTAIWFLWSGFARLFLNGPSGFDVMTDTMMGLMFVLPSFVASLLGGWLGLRQKGRRQA